MAKACWAFLALKLVVARGRPIGDKWLKRK